MADIHKYFIAGFAVVAICVGAWFGYWKLSGSAESHRYHVNTHSQGYQQSLIDQERDRVYAYDQAGQAIATTRDATIRAADEAQQSQIKTTFCAVYADLNDAPDDLTQAHTRICD